ncbi:MAG: MFS transporter, partial [Peptococcaceae bacterium]|nr:MFS transporter [Peptococcaceae bacterium]
MKRFMQKAALLSMCPIAMVTALLTSSMVYIYQAYPALSESTVTLVLTIPNLTVIAGLVLAPILVKRYSIKYLIVIGMTMFTMGNAVCAWIDNFYLMLFFRAVSGVGSGLVVPLQNTFIASYPEQERATLLGLNGVMGAVIVAPLAVISGIVATINWRYVFSLYLVNLVVILMVAVFLPKHIAQPANTAKNTGDGSENKPKLSEYS